MPAKKNRKGRDDRGTTACVVQRVKRLRGRLGGEGGRAAVGESDCLGGGEPVTALTGPSRSLLRGQGLTERRSNPPKKVSRYKIEGPPLRRPGGA